MTARRVLWHAACLAALVVLLYPVVWLLTASVKPANEILSSLSLLPERVIFGNYAEVFGGMAGVSVWQFLANSLLVSGGAVVGNVVSCSLAAYAFAWLRFRLRGPMFAFMIATIMLPVHVLLIPQYTIFQRMGLVDTVWPLILPKLLATDAFFIFLMVQFMRTIPRELDEAARLDGCGHFRIYARIVMPLCLPALATSAVFTFIWTWNDFFSQLIFLTDPDKYTVPVALRSFMDAQSGTSWGPLFAMSVVALVPIFGFFLAGQRYLTRGIATTGLK